MNRYYLYAIGPAGAAPPADLTGIQGAPVMAISGPGLTAYVSPLKAERIRPERRNLMAHQQVLRALMDMTTPLPMSFGTLAADEARTRQLLERHREEFAAQLERVRDCVEMGLRVSWDVANIFEYFVSRYPQLRELRDEVRATETSQAAIRPQLRVELGRRFEQLREAERATIDSRVAATIEPSVREIHRGTCRNETDVLHFSCLVERSRQDAFAAAVIEAASHFDSNFSFDYNGPWAPYHFVNLEIEAPDA